MVSCNVFILNCQSVEKRLLVLDEGGGHHAVVGGHSVHEHGGCEGGALLCLGRQQTVQQHEALGAARARTLVYAHGRSQVWQGCVRAPRIARRAASHSPLRGGLIGQPTPHPLGN